MRFYGSALQLHEISFNNMQQSTIMYFIDT